MNQDPLSGLSPAPQWGLLAGELGKVAVGLGLILFVVAAVLWGVGGTRSHLSKIATGLFVAGCGGLFVAMAVLAGLFINNQFEFKYVFDHGGSDVSLPYKIASTWTAQEGSFLLWGTTSALFGVLTIWGTGLYKRWYGVAYSAFLGAICGILAYESPFNLIAEIQRKGVTYLPNHGAGMVPSLQNYWVIIHPPTIFTGFGSLTVMFAYAVSAMLTGDAKNWIAKVRPWTLVSTAILGLGVCMGGLWAYETLGWGGFWQWDPVENVSFVPWLFAVAFIHGTIVQNTKGRWTSSNLFLGGLPFLLFVYGTFLTRSGLLDGASNHSFASMDKSALIILRWFMFAVTAFFVGLFAFKGRSLAKSEPKAESEQALHREGFYRFSVLTVSLFAATIALGMSWPVITALRGGKGAAIEEPTYHMVVAWFFLPALVAMAIAPFVSWRSIGARELWVRISSVISISAGLTGFTMLALTNSLFGVHLRGGEHVRMPFGYQMALVPWMAILLFACMFVAVANMWRAIETSKRSSSSLGGFVAHLGFATLMAGLIISRGFEQKESDYVQDGSPAKLLDYEVTFKGLRGASLMDRNNKAIFEVRSTDGSSFEARPGLYFYGMDQGENPNVQVWPHVERYLSHDIYLSLHPPILKAWDEPEIFKPGATKVIGKMMISYLEPTRHGAFGQPGTKFGAKLRIQTSDGTFDVEPTLTLTDQGLKNTPVPVGKDLNVYLMSMDAADQSVSVMMSLTKPAFPIDLYYKPMTGLVWLGTGVMTLGGILSAFARRSKKAVKTPAPVKKLERDNSGFTTEPSPDPVGSSV